MHFFSEGFIIEPERESRMDECVECCVRAKDSSKKPVYQCHFCERWFCEKHIDARMAFLKNWKLIDKNPEVRALYYTEMQREDGHPDFAYTRMKFMELDFEEKERNTLISQALDEMNDYYKKSQNERDRIRFTRHILDKMNEDKIGLCPKCHFHRSEMIAFDAETMTFECHHCWHKWTQSKSEPYEIIETEKSKPKENQNRVESKKSEKKRSGFRLWH